MGFMVTVHQGKRGREIYKQTAPSSSLRLRYTATQCSYQCAVTVHTRGALWAENNEGFWFSFQVSKTKGLQLVWEVISAAF